MAAIVKGFGCRPVVTYPVLRAGVRKPPRKEPAGAWWAVCGLWGFGRAGASASGHCHINELSPLSSSLSPDFGAGQQARLAFPDPEPPATYAYSIPRRLKLTMPSDHPFLVPPARVIQGPRFPYRGPYSPWSKPQVGKEIGGGRILWVPYRQEVGEKIARGRLPGPWADSPARSAMVGETLGRFQRYRRTEQSRKVSGPVRHSGCRPAGRARVQLHCQ
jgi:hypothetical protein